MIEEEETTFEEVVHRIRGGDFYEDYDWASGPALRALDRAAARMAEAEIARDEAGFLGSVADCIRCLNDELSGKRTLQIPVLPLRFAKLYVQVLKDDAAALRARAEALADRDSGSLDVLALKIAAAASEQEATRAAKQARISE